MTTCHSHGTRVLETHRGKVDGQTILVGQYNRLKPPGRERPTLGPGHRRKTSGSFAAGDIHRLALEVPLERLLHGADHQQVPRAKTRALFTGRCGRTGCEVVSMFSPPTSSYSTPARSCCCVYCLPFPAQPPTGGGDYIFYGWGPRDSFCSCVRDGGELRPCAGPSSSSGQAGPKPVDGATAALVVFGWWPAGLAGLLKVRSHSLERRPGTTVCSMFGAGLRLPVLPDRPADRISFSDLLTISATP